jgi:uncharacterized protein (TIGR02246 family)
LAGIAVSYFAGFRLVAFAAPSASLSLTALVVTLRTTTVLPQALRYNDRCNPFVSGRTEMPQQIARPRFDTDPDAAAAARAAVDSLIAELQDGIDRSDADVYNRHFAADVIWGSPYGAIVSGYDRLHAIHERLHRNAPVGRSRYVTERVLAPAPDIAVAQVRRVALGDGGEALDPADSFHEMATYVLVRRNDEWWLVAGQNTPIRPGMGAKVD